MNRRYRAAVPLLAFAVLLAGSILLPGCDRAPDVLAPTAATLADGAPGGAADPASLDALLDPVWNLVASRLVIPGVTTLVEGSRYSLKFKVGSLAQPALITISERDGHVADAEFGPSGSRFDVPLEVTIDYSGTALDPESPSYRGLPVRAYWFNPDARSWEQIPATVDRGAKTVRFEVSHFSRYGLTDAVTEGEWQWGRTGRGRDTVDQGGGR